MRLDPPLDPTSPQARQWLEDELRKGIYHEQKGLLERIWDWLMSLLSGTGSGGARRPGRSGSRSPSSRPWSPWCWRARCAPNAG